jgi:hypothetical protein
MRIVALVILQAYLLSGSVLAQDAKTFGAPSPGRTRTYYIAANEVDWDYASTRSDLVNGVRYHFESNPGGKGAMDPNSAVYRKALFREYTDANFTAVKPREEAWAHLGILGPLIRAEVGVTIQVVFKNQASRPYSVHPHGVFYGKDSEGTSYQDGTSGKDREDDAVPPGGTHTYVWPGQTRPTNHFFFAGATGAAFAYDQAALRQVPKTNKSLIDKSETLSEFGSPYATFGEAGALYLLGALKHNDHLRETGILGAEAVANASLVAEGLKLVTNRERPNDVIGQGTFWPPNHYSLDSFFPSGHAAAS